MYITIKDYLLNENNNETKIVYHASNVVFKKFDISKITNIRGDLYGKGFYFSDNTKYIKQFGPIIYKCEINLSNPIDLTDSKKAKKQLMELFNVIDNITDYDNSYIKDSIKSNDLVSAFRKIRKYLSFSDINTFFDGVIGYSEMGGKEYVVYNSNDINILEITK